VSRDGDSPKSRLGNDTPPSGRSLLDGLLEKVVEQEGLELVVLLESLGDVGQEDGLDDTTSSPHLGDTSVVQRPTVFLSGLTHEHESLGVGHDLGGVKGLFEVIDELLLVTSESLPGGSGEDLGSPDTLGLEGRQASSKDGLSDQGDGGTHVEGVDSGPLSGSLLTGRVQNLLDNGDTILIVLPQDLVGDLDQERVEDSLVPLQVVWMLAMLSTYTRNARC
jgi:hypothetical protein